MLTKISQLQNSKSRGHCYFWENLQDIPNNLGSEECCSDLQKCIYEHPLGAQQCNANPFKANFPSFLPRKNPNALQFCPIFHPPTDIAQMPKDLPLIRGFSFQIAGMGNFLSINLLITAHLKAALWNTWEIPGWVSGL